MNAWGTTRRGADCAITGRVATTADCDKNVARTRHIIPERVRFAFGFAPLGQAPALAAILLLSWAAIVAATGGFRIEIGPLRISSRNATRIAYAGGILALVAWQLAYREHVRQAARALPGLLTRTEARFAAAY